LENGRRTLRILMKKPRPTIEKMREEVTRFEIEEVYHSKDYQAMLEDNLEEGWQSEEDIVEWYKNEDDGEVEYIWDEWFNQFGDYEEKKNEKIPS
jgi:predicted metal-dependent hydrolase